MVVPVAKLLQSTRFSRVFDFPKLDAFSPGIAAANSMNEMGRSFMI